MRPCLAEPRIAVADLFFNTPARRKFLRAESTELAHVTALVTHYALAHPEKHFELLSATPHHPLRAARHAHRRAHLPDLRQGDAGPTAARGRRNSAGARRPARAAALEEEIPTSPPRDPGTLRLTGFYSKPELQKLNRNSIYIFVNKRLIRDRLLLHAITEAYRNVIPPTSFPVVLLFLEMPPEEVDVNVHPAKTEVRFRQQSLVHDFVRDSLRTALIKARPAAGFLAALDSQPTASPSLMPPAASPLPGVPDSASRQTCRCRSFPTHAGAEFRSTDSRLALRSGLVPFDRKIGRVAGNLDRRHGARQQTRSWLRPRHKAPGIAAQTSMEQQLTASSPTVATALVEAEQAAKSSTISAHSGRWASCAIPSFWRRATTVYGSSTSMSHMSECFLRRSCATARWSESSASACSCRCLWN